MEHDDDPTGPTRVPLRVAPAVVLRHGGSQPHFHGLEGARCWCSERPVGSATGILCSSNTNTLDEILRRLCRRWKRQERSTTSGIVHNWRLMLFNLGKKEVSSKATTRSLEGSEVGYQGTTTSMEQIPRLYHRTQQGVRLIMDRDLVLGAAYPLRMSGTVLQEAEHRHKLNWWLSRKDEMLRGHHELLIKHVRTTLPLREALGHPVD
ncbi:hypothetical protein SAICODRAFT_26733 [Saitoella complicata NRRL Y-17804]|uniref:uncharacterized protein n=1 Tax=Saitoella complicata (strain BCRC 22490 / CBS 7301 / JCM 7358 / NBRC 10748 / NRRL Y-17804) TaxID=698492 RepID=UPI000867A914|nr:uncharacterized protein SAICODRAFT_26733 [Saitoella complicata NRRL Y-17804]ODQ51291.1 hypothetical protein SAICODRAFT_26733 [Saitoella complicata NRRL Y-17804]